MEPPSPGQCSVPRTPTPSSFSVPLRAISTSWGALRRTSNQSWGPLREAKAEKGRLLGLGLPFSHDSFEAWMRSRYPVDCNTIELTSSKRPQQGQSAIGLPWRRGRGLSTRRRPGHGLDSGRCSGLAGQSGCLGRRRSCRCLDSCCRCGRRLRFCSFVTPCGGGR